MKGRPYRVAVVATGLALVLVMFAAWLLNIPLPLVLLGGAIAGVVLVRLFGRSTPSQEDSRAE